jgi:hypothetical protein
LNGLTSFSCDLESKAKRTMDCSGGGLNQDLDVLFQSTQYLRDEFERPGWISKVPVTAFVHEATSIFPAGFYDESSGIFADSPYEDVSYDTPSSHRGIFPFEQSNAGLADQRGIAPISWKNRY